MKTELPRVGRYELQHCFRRNSIGEVWQAYDGDEQLTVLLKLYRTNLPVSTSAQIGFISAVEQIASLHHPNVVRVHDAQLLTSHGSDGPSDLLCLAMEYVEGESLADYIRATSAVGRMPLPGDIIQLYASIALALTSAYQRGIFHGNLKPANVLLKTSTLASGRIGIPMLTDFGATTALLKRPANSIPSYLAPEQVMGAPASCRSDIYALGAMLYELYTGGPPFRGYRPIAVMMQQVNAPPMPPDLVNPSISPALTHVILRCLAKDPRERYSHAASLVVDLGNALHVAVPQDLQRAAMLEKAETGSLQRAETVTNTSALGTSTFPPAPKRRRYPLVTMSLVALTLLLGASVASLLLLARGGAVSSAVTGQAFFLNSGQIDENSNQGINDELQVTLAHVPNPAPGKSYYAWLLSDSNQAETNPVFLGRVVVSQGSVRFLYRGDGRHTNLLGSASRFLIDEDDAHNPSSDPLLDQSTWRYYAAIPQTPNTSDALHFSMLDHLRHLLVESPELTVRGLHGGLAYWFVRDAATVSELANTLVDDRRMHDAGSIHNQLTRILDYLDGVSFVASDVPPGTPMLANPQLAQLALLGPVPQNASPPGYVYQNEAPPGYVFLIQAHMNGAVLSPQSTQQQRQLARQINGGIDTVKGWLTQTHQDARQLVRLPDAQLLQPSSRALLDDMVTLAQYAYTGQPGPSTGTAQGGALWIYSNLQRLASFDVAPYTLSER